MKYQGGKRTAVRIIIFLILSASLWASGFFVAKAIAPGDLLITRLQITGGPGKTDEDFVTIYNASSSALDLNGLRLVKRTKTGTSDTTLFSWASPTLLDPGAFYTWANSNNGFAASISAPASSSQTLANDNAVALRSGPANTGDIIDAVGWGTASNSLVETSPYPFNPGAGELLERIDFQDSDNNAADFRIISSLPLPECGNDILETDEECDDGNTESNDGCSDECRIELPEEEEPTEIRILINEFVSDPVSGSDEWIELYNAGETALALNGWTIEDGSGTKTMLTGTIGTEGENRFFVIAKPKGSLNNAGDAIILKDAVGTVQDSLAYGNWESSSLPAPGKAESLARTEDGGADFSLTTALTKGAPNTITLPETGPENLTEEEIYDYSETLLISEISPNPLGVDSLGDGEFIELFNRGSERVRLEGWRLDFGGRFVYEFPAGTSIASRSYLVLRSTAGFTLDNAGMSVKLYQPKRASAFQTVTYKETTEGQSYSLLDEQGRSINPVWRWTVLLTPGEENRFAAPPQAGFSFSAPLLPNQPIQFDSSDTDTGAETVSYRWDFGDGTTSDLPHPQHTYATSGTFSVQLSVTNIHGTSHLIKNLLIPGAESDEEEITAEPSPYDIRISEIFANAIGADEGKEWIEIQNAGSETINLKGWRLSLAAKAGKPFADDMSIKPGDFAVLPSVLLPGALGNTKETIRLFDDAGRLADDLSYTDAKENVSYALINGTWSWTKRLTPGAANILEAAAVKSSSSSTVKAVAGSKRQIFTGSVVALPNTFSSQYFFIKLDTAEAIHQVYSSKKLFPELRLGDRISVTGEPSTVQAGPRIKTTALEDIIFLSPGEPLLPQPENSTALANGYHPRLVRVEGEVVSKKSPRLILTDEAGEIEVYLASNSGLSVSTFVVGDKLAVTGLTQRDGTSIRVMPRSQTDIEFTDKPNGPESTISPEALETRFADQQRDPKKQLFSYLLLGAAITIAALSYIVWKYRKT